jgi:hypothetical protein
VRKRDQYFRNWLFLNYFHYLYLTILTLQLGITCMRSSGGVPGGKTSLLPQRLYAARAVRLRVFFAQYRYFAGCSGTLKPTIGVDGRKHR